MRVIIARIRVALELALLERELNIRAILVIAARPGRFSRARFAVLVPSRRRDIPRVHGT